MSGRRDSPQRPSPSAGPHVVYCLVPRELASELHELLRDFYAADPSVRVVVEARWRERRRGRRRGTDVAAASEQRRVHSPEGRRIAERRAPTAPVEPPQIPPAAAPYADRLRFVERIEPTEGEVEDGDSARLAIASQAGDEDAINELYMRYFDRVYGYARLALHDSHEAEDVTQQVFLKLFQALPRYEVREGKPFRAWLFRIARNAVIDSLRRHGRFTVEDPSRIDYRRDAPASEEVPSGLAWLSDGELARFIERLPQARRDVIVLRFMLDLSTEDIAAVMHKTPGAVHKLEQRALSILEARLVAMGRRAPGRDKSTPATWGRTDSSPGRDG